MEYKKAYKSIKGRDAVLKAYDDVLGKWTVPYETMDVETSHGRTFILKCGEDTSPTLLLLHGTSSNSSLWLDDVTEYTQHFCVYAIDIPGEPGKSEDRQYSLKGTAYFDWLNEIVEAMDLRRISIAGISLGAWLGAGYAVRHPDRVEKLVLLCPSGFGRQRNSFLWKALPLMFLGKWGQNRISQMVNGGIPLPREVSEYTNLLSRHFNIRTETIPLYRDEELKKLTMPVLLYVGEKDVLLNSQETVRRVSMLLPQVKIHYLKNRGHVITGCKADIAKFLVDEE